MNSGDAVGYYAKSVYFSGNSAMWIAFLKKPVR